VDFFGQLGPNAKIFAFQFKAPKGKKENAPYKYTLRREQHHLLYELASVSSSGVFYVFPYYVTFQKLQQDVPDLMRDTWLLNVKQVPTAQAFGNMTTRTIRCAGKTAYINPEYELEGLHDIRLSPKIGIPASWFAEWYAHFRRFREQTEEHRDPWLVRGLRVAIVKP
jgi:hypothetical protein